MDTTAQKTRPQQIDAIDDQIIALLERRFALSRAIGEAKKAQGAAPYDPVRVRNQVERFVAACQQRDLEPVMARQVICAVIAQVVSERFPTEAT